MKARRRDREKNKIKYRVPRISMRRPRQVSLNKISPSFYLLLLYARCWALKVYIIISLLPTKEKLRARGKRGLLLFLQVYTLWFIYLEPKKALVAWRRRGTAKWNTPLRCCQLEKLIAADWAKLKPKQWHTSNLIKVVLIAHTQNTAMRTYELLTELSAERRRLLTSRRGDN